MTPPGVVKDISLPSFADPFPERIVAPDTAIPGYLRDVYTWAYLNPRNVAFLDRPLVVHTLLFGNANRLAHAVLEEIKPGQSVLLSAHVYGDLVQRLVLKVGSQGHLEVIDIAPVQVSNCRRKLSGHPNAVVRRADAADPGGGPYDVAVSFFLLHEVPDGKKRAVIDALLGNLAPGGKAVFIDYHNPSRLNPVRYILGVVNSILEPFASALWRHAITEFATDPTAFRWTKRTFFGGVYQKVVACRSNPTLGAESP